MTRAMSPTQSGMAIAMPIQTPRITRPPAGADRRRSATCSRRANVR